MLDCSSCLFFVQDCSFPAYFYTQPMATGPGFYDNLCPQSWQDGSAATWTLQDPHQQSKKASLASISRQKTDFCILFSFRLPGQLSGLYQKQCVRNAVKIVFHKTVFIMFWLLHKHVLIMK